MSKLGTKTASADNVVIMLQPGAVEGNFAEWRECAIKDAANLPLSLSLHLSFLHTEVRYVPPQINMLEYYYYVGVVSRIYYTAHVSLFCFVPYRPYVIYD
jgi:hypothetical protein